MFNKTITMKIFKALKELLRKPDEVWVGKVKLKEVKGGKHDYDNIPN